MANVLCQIRGQKRLILYHPSDVNKLGFPPGASSSPLKNLHCKDASEAGDAGVQRYECVLAPGDILLIPPFWPHTAVPVENTSIAVNVFFRSLQDGYAPGKDIYGNRDLQAYEKGRQDIQRISKSFKNLPAEAAQFYLARLAAELQDISLRGTRKDRE